MKTYSLSQTNWLGYRLGKLLQPPACLALSGELGAGKTCLAQAVMRGLGIEQDYLTSPTYTIVNQYQSPKGPVFHCDLYRLAQARQVEELGLLEQLETGITLIEWPEIILPQLAEAGFLHIKLEPEGAQQRRISFSAYGRRHRQILERITQEGKK